MNHRYTIAAFALIAMLTPVMTTACSNSSSIKSSTVKFDSVPNDRKLVDNGDPGASIGDALFSNGELKNDTGDVIGRYSMHASTTQILPGREERFLTIEYEFSDGDAIEAQGSNDYPLANSSGQPTAEGHGDDTLILGIIGGTGRYDTARGSCVLTFEAPAYLVDCTVKQ